MFVYLRESRLSPRVCDKVKKYLFPQLTTIVGKLIYPNGSQVWVETQTRVEKGQKIASAEAIPTGVVYFQR